MTTPLSPSTPALVLCEVGLQRFKAAFSPAPVKLTPFTIVIGRNGSGKSTLIEALQWIDRTLREDARRACERYQGIRDIINVRSRTKRRFFGMTLRWQDREPSEGLRELAYSLQIDESRDGLPLVHSERFDATVGGRRRKLVETAELGNALSARPGVRQLFPGDSQRQRVFDDPDRLVLGTAGRAAANAGELEAQVAHVKDFWDRAVFLRLSPNSLAGGSPAHRSSFEPMLDEEGLMLPALLTELTEVQRKGVVEDVNDVLRGIQGLDVTRPRHGRAERVHFSLLEEMPWVGRKGTGKFKIPSWMLSEGTRRITAIFALLRHSPPPSLLCIEELENGLDPWTTLTLLRRLQEAAQNRTQIVATTHSPWLLDHVSVEDVLMVDRVRGDTRYTRAVDRKTFMDFASDIPPGARYVNLEQK